MSAFGELGVCDEITEGLEEIGWNLPTDIQAEVLTQRSISSRRVKLNV